VARMDARALSLEDVAALRTYLPTADEAAALRAYGGPPDALAPPDRHFLHLLAVPLLCERLEAFAFLLSFDTRARALRGAAAGVRAACARLEGSAELRRVLAVVLATGNELNEGTFNGGARGFHLQALPALQELRGSGGKTELLGELVAAARRSGALPELAALPAALAGAEEVRRESFLELEAEAGALAEGVARLRALLAKVDQDQVLAEVLAAFLSRAAEEPARLSDALAAAAAAFDRVAALLVFDRKLPVHTKRPVTPGVVPGRPVLPGRGALQRVGAGRD
jgi:hypothetical protein